ncbi:MAG: chorismate mutase [Chloroflexota bacterium]|nr:chorismate mutase [Chloroflexota bacterium]MDE3100934.1 chorismate mutase [Chloroflexota bacterium]
MTAVRGVRGATTVAANDRDQIVSATKGLLERIVALNGMVPDDVASVWFTVTPDLDAEFPAVAARGIGWTDVPLICGREIPVPGSLERCIRVLIHWNTDRAQSEVRHAFLREARALRPQWAVDEREAT